MWKQIIEFWTETVLMRALFLPPMRRSTRRGRDDRRDR